MLLSVPLRNHQLYITSIAVCANHSLRSSRLAFDSTFTRVAFCKLARSLRQLLLQLLDLSQCGCKSLLELLLLVASHQLHACHAGRQRFPSYHLSVLMLSDDTNGPKTCFQPCWGC